MSNGVSGVAVDPVLGDELERFWRLVENPETPPGYWAERRSGSSEGVYGERVGGPIHIVFRREKMGESSEDSQNIPLNLNTLCRIRDASEVWKKVHGERVALVKAALGSSLGSTQPLIDLCITFLEQPVPVPSFLFTQGSLVKQQIEAINKHFGEGELWDLPERPSIPGTVLRSFDLGDKFMQPLALPVVPIQQRILVVSIKAGEQATLHFRFNQQAESLFVDGGWYKSHQWRVQASLDSGKGHTVMCDPRRAKNWSPISETSMVQRDAAEASGSMTLLTFPLIATHELEMACQDQEVSLKAPRGFLDRAIAHSRAKQSMRSPAEKVQTALAALRAEEAHIPPIEFRQLMRQMASKETEDTIRMAHQLYRKPVDPARDFSKLRLHPRNWSVTRIIPVSDKATDEEVARAYEEEVLGTSSASSSSSSHSSSSANNATSSSAAVADSKAK